MAVHTTKQAVFNIVWEEFAVKGRPQAFDQAAGKCVYRGLNPATKKREADSDMRCVVGVCIPDNMYDPDLDSYGSISRVHGNMSKWYNRVFNGIDVKYLILLQRAHDTSPPGETFTKSMNTKLREIAEDQDLTIPGE